MEEQNLIQAKEKDFFDFSLGNWEINRFPYDIDKKYDLVLCTRCPYFCSNPILFLEECHRILKPGGKIFIDWGLGDHLRFDKFRVGFKDENFHEYGYSEDNFLYSCLWDHGFINHDEVLKFSHRIKKFGYDDLNAAVKNEIPSILKLEDVGKLFKNLAVGFAALWEDQPQLYIVLQGEKI